MLFRDHIKRFSLFFCKLLDTLLHSIKRSGVSNAVFIQRRRFIQNRISAITPPSSRKRRIPFIRCGVYSRAAISQANTVSIGMSSSPVFMSDTTTQLRKIFYYMEKSVLLGTKPLVDSIRHFIRDPSGIFSVCHLCECRMVQ